MPFDKLRAGFHRRNGSAWRLPSEGDRGRGRPRHKVWIEAGFARLRRRGL